MAEIGISLELISINAQSHSNYMRRKRESRASAPSTEIHKKYYCLFITESLDLDVLPRR